MAGLVPAIHVWSQRKQDVDARHKAGHDEEPEQENTMPNSNVPRRTFVLTGASRGIGHATVIRFSSAGWRVITCSRHPFPEDCPWDAGPEDHIQVDLADPADTTRAIGEIRRRLQGGTQPARANRFATLFRKSRLDLLGSSRGNANKRSPSANITHHH